MHTDKSQQILWRGRIIRYAPLILWLVVIFVNSSSAGAMSNTSRIIRPLLEWLFPLADAAALDVYHGYIRKLAHFAEYAVLAFFASRAFWLSSQTILRKFWFVWAFLFVVLVASADEFNQSFNNQRTGSLYDVLIDITGGLFAVAVLYTIKMRGRKANRNEDQSPEN